MLLISETHFFDQPQSHHKERTGTAQEIRIHQGFRVVFTSLLIAVGLALGCMSLMAQDGGGPGGPGGRGNFNPQAMMDRYRDQLVVTNDETWTAISNKIAAVMTARQAVMAGERGPRGGGRRAGGPGGPAAGADSRGSGGPPPGPGGLGPRGGGGFGGPPQTESEAALRKAVRDNTPEADIKAALATVRAEHKAKEEAYAKAQDDLRGLLNARQEAQMTLAGVLR